MNGKEKPKEKFHFHFTETGYNNINCMTEDSYLNMNGMLVTCHLILEFGHVTNEI